MPILGVNMALKINAEIPNINVKTTQGEVNIHDWLEDSWGIIFSHPKDFTPVCTTELGALANLHERFNSLDTKIIGVSIDSLEDHLNWIKDINEVNNTEVKFPLIADENLEFSKTFQMLPEEENPSSERTAVDNATVRVVYIVGPDKKVKASLAYPMSSGRNFDEIERLLVSCQLTANHKVATPANWKVGKEVIIIPSIEDEEAKEIFKEWVAPKPYMRFVKDPSKS